MNRIMSGIEAIFRPIAKELIKGGIVVADAVSEFASETGEQLKDLLAEAKAELEKPAYQAQEQTQETDKTDETGSKDSHKRRSARTGGGRVKK